MYDLPTNYSYEKGTCGYVGHGCTNRRAIPMNRPDIFIHDNWQQECRLIDIAIPDECSMTKKHNENISKYKDLEIDMQRM